MVEKNKLLYGINTFTKQKQQSNLKKLMSIYLQPFNLLLFIASILSFFVYSIGTNDKPSLFLGIGIFSVSIFNTLLEFYQEYKTNAILESFKNLVPGKCKVIRNGNLKEIFIHEIVVGDLVDLRMGDKIGADIRLLTVTKLKVDNSSLTGESIPITKKIESKESDILRAENMVFSGNLIVNGEGLGIVVNVGDKTALGKIARLTITKKHGKSELTEEINLYVKKLGLIALITSIVFYVVAMFNGFTIRDNLTFCIGVFIAFVPQGLPATVTILMTIAAKRMAQNNVLVKDLRAVETLGSISLLASDKTGTLTQGKMTCANIWDGKIVQSLLNNNNDQFRNIREICSLTSKVQITENKEILGDPTETALYIFSNGFKPDSQVKIINEEPFNSEKKYQLTIVEEKNIRKVYLKGAPERILNLCSKVKMNKSEMDIDSNFHKKFNDIYQEFASQGQRVIAMAEKTVDNNFNNTEHDLNGFIFLCLIGIIDPPKQGVKNAIMKLRLAGIQVVMITGDHPLTAEYIGRQINIISGKTRQQALKSKQMHIKFKDETKSEVYTNNISNCSLNEITSELDFSQKENDYEAEIICGDEIDALTELDWLRILSKKEIIFARTSPKQKLLIVEKFQEQGHIVGVSGDGVNDSPALKKAHLGISMNKTANEVSKEAASMILLDDNFTSIVQGVLEGRLIFVNLKKSIRYILSHITPQVIPFLLFVSLGVPSPMSAILLMFIDLFTEFFPAVSLAWEPAEGNLMIEKPRKHPNVKGNATEKEIISNKQNDTKETISNNIMPGSSIVTQIKSLFKTKSSGETLCDFNLLSWSYLEAGMLITIGSLLSFFMVIYLSGVPLNYLYMSSQYFFKSTATAIQLTNGKLANNLEQLEILYKAQSAYFYSILIGQTFNLITCKRKYYCLSSNNFKNMFPFLGAFIGLSFGYIIIYFSFLNKYLFSRPVELKYFICPILTGIFILIWNEMRRNIKIKIFGGHGADMLCRLKRSRFIDQRS